MLTLSEMKEALEQVEATWSSDDMRACYNCGADTRVARCVGYRAARRLNQCGITDTVHCAAKFLGSREEGAAAIEALGAEVKRVIKEESGE